MLFKDDDRFIEVTEDHDQKNGPYIGLFQPPGSREPKGGWRWVTDEPLNYTNWTNDQPNNNSGKSDIAWFYSYGKLSPRDEQRPIRWDDAEAQWGSRGFVMEAE